MNCWKTINLSKDIGLYRILLISMITIIFVFILTYLPINLLLPNVHLTTALILGSMYFPAYMHYFCIALPFHIGLCVPDFIFIKHLLFAPKMCFIEEFEDGYEVLVQK